MAKRFVLFGKYLRIPTFVSTAVRNNRVWKKNLCIGGTFTYICIKIRFVVTVLSNLIFCFLINLGYKYYTVNTAKRKRLFSHMRKVFVVF